MKRNCKMAAIDKNGLFLEKFFLDEDPFRF